MPGLNQLKQFNSDLLNLGDEVKIRSARGEKPSIVPIPKDVEDRDDSDDFRNGMPMLSEEEQAQADAALAEAERAKNDFSDITGEYGDDEEDEEEAAPVAPDVSNLLSPTDITLDDIDLSDFETPEEPAAPVKKEIPIEDLDLDSLLALKEEPVEEQELEPETLEEPVDLSDMPEFVGEDEASNLGEPDELDAVEPLELEVEEIEPAEMDSAESDFSGLGDPADLGDFDFNEVSDINIPSDIPEMPADTEAEQSNAEAEESLDAVESDNLDFGDFSTGGSALDLGSEDSLGVGDSFDDLDLSSDFGMGDTSELDGSIDIPNDIPELNDIDTPKMDSDDSEFSESESPVEEMDLPRDLGQSDEGDNASSGDDSFEMPDVSDMSFDAPEDSGETDAVDMRDMSDMSFDAPEDSSGADAVEMPDVSDMSFDAPEVSDESTDFNETNEPLGNEESFDTPESFDNSNLDFIDPKSEDNETSQTETSDSENFSIEDFGMDSDSLPSDFEAPSMDASASDDEGTPSVPGMEETAASDEMSFDVPNFDVMDGASGSDSDSDYSLPDFDFNSLGSGEGISPDMEVPDGEGENFEVFDTSAISGFDFSSDEGTDFELGNITTQETDEDDLFSIPGFSDTVTADLNKNNKPNVQTPDFSEALEDESGRVKNTFTDNEYKKFQKNLESYPLNIRIAIEDLVVKNEFTDDAVFGILEKVYRKAPARQIASELEKMLDVSLDVPRDFERRTAAEYEAYKKSLEYQLKNRILPAAILSTGAAIFAACLFLIVRTFIIFPVTASNLYKQGYVLLENNQYDQALDRFNDAVNYNNVKEWYYKYANGFREHKQYDRATNMYKAILTFFDHEKRAGMEWADMECYDLYNYEETERILKREVLDYHINDLDAITMLGDLYLDWATEVDSSKFPLAKAEYDRLLELGSASEQNKYLSRQMRYYIRTDNLRQVLGYKEYFFDIKGKQGLGSKDLTELSGYLLDKLYGTLTPAEESLRFNIENVRELLERAIKADPSNPIALYNMGRYFVETKNRSAESLLKSSIDKFNVQSKRSRGETYKYINCFRLLGEEYRDQREYIRAEETYGNGITLYEKEHDESGFESDVNIGKLYADMADLDYFISGDMDHALTNYINSVNNKNDTSSIRYRIGYIQYKNENYTEALGSFIRSSEVTPTDTHLLLALANTLSQKGDNYAAQGYYERLLTLLNSERELHDVILPQVRSDQADLVDVYMKTSNNLGVTYARLSQATGNSSMNGKALINLQESIRAWDAMTRNQDTLVRLEGSNLAEQNIKYITNPKFEFEPEIYTEVFKLMNGEEGLK